MTDDQKQEIARLAGDMHDKNARFKELRNMNIYGASYDESRKQTIKYELARAECYEARAALDFAIEIASKHPSNMGGGA